MSLLGSFQRHQQVVIADRLALMRDTMPLR
jgi:hypothetical protein